jgi:hypothetical protein
MKVPGKHWKLVLLPVELLGVAVVVVAVEEATLVVVAADDDTGLVTTVVPVEDVTVGQTMEAVVMAVEHERHEAKVAVLTELGW